MISTTQLTELLGLERQPVAITFCQTAPDGVPRIDATAPSGCTYWKFAAEGQTFYTDASDHYGCPVGAHTHGIDLPPDTSKELDWLVGTMVQLEYVDMQEVAEIPRRAEPFGVVVYAPFSDADIAPDVVFVSGNAKQLMLLAEAAQSAGVDGATSVVGRPTCAAIPAVIESGRSATNLGCIGNRVYTDIADDQLYFAINGTQVARVVDRLHVIVNANRELEQFHRGRLK